jgi:hypothetical protein
MTRALLFLAHGDWHSALASHPLAPLFVAQGIAGWIFWGLVERGSVPPPSRRELNGWLIGNAALLLAVWAWRFSHGTLPS